MSDLPGLLQTMKKKHLCPKTLDRWMDDHPHITLLLLFFAMPLFILGTVFLGTVAVMLPFSLLFGWM